MMRLAEFSRDRLIDLRAVTGIEYDQRLRGTLQVFKSQRQFDGVAKDLKVLRAANVPFEIMDSVALLWNRACAQWPQRLGAVYISRTMRPAIDFNSPLNSRHCAAQGVTFRLETRIDKLCLKGNRIRVGGMAEVSGFNDELHTKRRATLQHSHESLFPGAGDLQARTFWAGLRPMTRDGTPVIGATPFRSLF